MKNWIKAGLAATAIALTAQAQAAECPHRGELDAIYCDANRDMVADPPADAKDLKDPKTIVFAFSPIEDPGVYAVMLKDFVDHLNRCTGRRVSFFQVQSTSAEVEAMRAGRLHVAGFPTGGMVYGVNVAGAVPFAIKGSEKGIQGYKLIAIVKKDSPYQKLSDLKGKRFAHTSPSSNSGNLAPIALFPKEGLVPGKDYDIVFSGKHDQSIMGVSVGDYDGAAVTSDVFERMAERGQIKAEDFRILYTSDTFPSSPFAYAHDLAPAVVDKLKTCFFNYHFTDEMKKTFNGSDRFLPFDYKKDFAVIREVAEKSAEAKKQASAQPDKQ